MYMEKKMRIKRKEKLSKKNSERQRRKIWVL